MAGPVYDAKPSNWPPHTHIQPPHTPNPPTRVLGAPMPPPDDEYLARQLAARSLVSWKNIIDILKKKHGIKVNVRAGEQWEVK